jgi:protein TonB
MSVRSRKPRSLFPILLCFSLGLHAVIFAFFKYSSPVRAVQKPEIAEVFSLINIALIEESEPVIDLVDPVPPPPEPVSTPPPAINEAPEIFIETEEMLPAADESPAPALPETAVVTVPAGSVLTAEKPPQAPTGNPAQTAAYIKQNYNYIQRRIRDRLRYPQEARRAGIQGQAEVIFTIHQDGTVSGAAIHLSSGNEILDQAAVEAVYAATPFRPSPAPARIIVPISFKLR